MKKILIGVGLGVVLCGGLFFGYLMWNRHNTQHLIADEVARRVVGIEQFLSEKIKRGELKPVQ